MPGSPLTSERFLALDVGYDDATATVGAVTFEQWEATAPTRTLKTTLPTPSDYTPGEFYRRELPCLLALIEEFDLSPEIIVIDGFVYLDGDRKPGLGKRLFDALRGEVCVVGVAKTSFQGIPESSLLNRGRSSRPLYVTCEGMNLDAAKAGVLSMHGPHRIPTLLKLADRLSRTK